MAFEVFADPAPTFRRWLAAESRPAAAHGNGERAFIGVGCAACHTIRGTPADGDVGPDLTHVAARTTLAGLTIPNADAYLREWVRDPQHVKPGNKMPAVGLDDRELAELLDYLESLG
jgi:cytochrome c oxidase subunit 2